MIGDIKHFRFWCQKVLPLVYNNSLSYYEVLCKVSAKLNELINNVNDIPEYIDAKIEESFDEEHITEILTQFIAKIQNAISANNEGTNVNSSKDYNVGQMLWLNDTLYRVIRPISAGATFIVDTNIEAVDFETLFNNFVDEVKHDITTNDDGTSATATQSWTAGQWLWLNDELYEVINDITQGNAYVFSGDNANVRQITVEEMISNEATSRADADEDLQTAISDEATDRENADTALQNTIGNLSNLDTTNKDNIVSAINELADDIESGNGYIDISKRGCVGDGVTDNTKLLQSLLDEAMETGNTLYIPKGAYLCDTLWVSRNIRIVGNGEIKSSGFKYYTLASNATAGDTTITVTDGSLYHVNNVLRITNGTTNDIMVVTEISDNTLTIKKFRYFDTYPTSGDGLKNSYSAGSTIIKCPLQMFISYAIASTSNENDFNSYIIDNVYIEGITFRGEIASFDNAYLSVYDVTIINGGLVVYMASNVTINKCKFYNRIAHHVIFVGKCRDWKVENSYFTNAVGIGTSASWNDSACGITNHWDERTGNTAHISENFEIQNCVIDNCYCGIFESAGKNGLIHDNIITECQHYGVDIYQGDTALGTQLINVHHNVIKNIVNTDGYTEGRGIGITGGDACIIDANDLYTNTVGIFVNLSSSLMISNNQCIGNTKASLEIHRATTSDVVGNRFASGSGTTNNVLINNDTALSATINFSGNVYQGNNASGNSAVHIVAGAMGIYFINEIIRSIRMFKIEDVIDTTSATIMCINCAQVVDSTNLFASTDTELAKIILINCYTAYQNMIRNSDGVNSKPTSSLTAITSGVKGATQYDETTASLKTFDGSAWVAV